MRARPLARALLGNEGSAAAVVVAAGWYAATAVVYFWTVVARAELRPRRAAGIALASGLLVGAGGLAMVELRPGLEGLLIGNLLGQLLVAVVTTLMMRDHALRVPLVSRARELLAFSLPLVVSSLAFVGAMYVDRFVVRGYLGLDGLSAYAVAARLAGGVGLLLIGLQSALTPLTYANVESDTLGRDLGRLLRWYVLVGAGLVILLVLLDDWVISVLAGSDYVDAAPVLAGLAAATLIRGAYVFFPGLFIARRTGLVALINIGGVAVSLLLCWAAVPLWVFAEQPLRPWSQHS